MFGKAPFGEPYSSADEAARGLWASNLAMSIPVSLNYPTANFQE